MLGHTVYQVSTTKNGKPCKRWDTISPPLVELNDNFNREEIPALENFCRNPILTQVGAKNGNNKKTWCFVQHQSMQELFAAIEKAQKGNTSDLYDECDLSDVPECGSVDDPERRECSKNYRGSVNETYQGYKCKCWNDVTLSNRPSDTNSTLTDNHNFCRNVAWLTDKPASKPWCYLHSEEDIRELGKNWDYCDVVGPGEDTCADFDSDDNVKNTQASQCAFVEKIIEKYQN